MWRPPRDSNSDFDLRRVAWYPFHQEGMDGAAGQNRTDYLLLTRQAHIQLCFNGVAEGEGFGPSVAVTDHGALAGRWAHQYPALP